MVTHCLGTACVKYVIHVSRHSGRGASRDPEPRPATGSYPSSQERLQPRFPARGPTATEAVADVAELPQSPRWSILPISFPPWRYRMSLTSQQLFESADLRIRQVICCAEHAGLSEVECATSDTLVLPLKGTFSKHLAPGGAFVATPSMALFFASGRPHRISHPHGRHDECLAIDFSDSVLSSALTGLSAVDRLSDNRLRPFAILPLRAAVARGLLAWRLRTGVTDGLETAETSLALLACVLRGARRDDDMKSRRRTTRKRHQEIVEGVQAALVDSTAETPSLSELAARVHATPFHVARTFREHVGLPIHEYLLRLRLSCTLTPLLESDHGMADIAAEHGFSSHSHFTYAFRRHAGITPVELRRLARTGRASEVRKIVTALAVDTV